MVLEDRKLILYGQNVNKSKQEEAEVLLEMLT
jgi:hypothetical protein